MLTVMISAAHAVATLGGCIGCFIVTSRSKKTEQQLQDEAIALYAIATFQTQPQPSGVDASQAQLASRQDDVQNRSSTLAPGEAETPVMGDEVGSTADTNAETQAVAKTTEASPKPEGPIPGTMR